MKILQLCCFSNLWSSIHDVTSIDLKTGQNVLSLSDDFGKNFDLIVSAPPCTQFTKANNLRWNPYPATQVKIAEKCFLISLRSGSKWFIENPPGRLETFLPGLSYYRLYTWHGGKTNKEYVIYSNFLMLFSIFPRYGKPGSVNNYSKNKRDLWQPDFIDSIAPFIF